MSDNREYLCYIHLPWGHIPTTNIATRLHSARGIFVLGRSTQFTAPVQSAPSMQLLEKSAHGSCGCNHRTGAQRGQLPDHWPAIHWGIASRLFEREQNGCRYS